jgi:aldehyde:ferredoxin oxidoreductase
MTTEQALNVGKRIVNIFKVYNLRAGIGKEYDYPSNRYGSTPVDGSTAGLSIMPHWEKMLSNYYQQLGWDHETGVPLPETLESLDLSHLVEDLKNI